MTAAVAATLFLSASAYAGSDAIEPAIVLVTDLGDVLADSKGMTLYTFAKDTSAVSNCYGKCADLWPPLLALEGVRPQGLYGVISLKDGARSGLASGCRSMAWIKVGPCNQSRIPAG